MSKKRSVRQQILAAKNPKDSQSNYEYITNLLHEKIYIEKRKQFPHIPKESLKTDLVLFLVEGKHDKKIWELFVQKQKTSVQFIRIPKRKKPDEYHSGKDAVRMVLDREYLEKFPSSPMVVKIKKNRVIGLIDLDFENLGGGNPSECSNLYQCQRYKNLFATETNDIETFLLCYGGFSIYQNKFLKTSDQSDVKQQYAHEIVATAELLGDAFRAAQNRIRFTHIDDISLDQFCKHLKCKKPEELIRNLVYLDEKNRKKDPVIIREFFTTFFRFRDERSNKTNNDRPPENDRNERNCVEKLSGCRGHTIMQVLCGYSSDVVKKDFIQNPKAFQDEPENILFDKIFEEFKDINSVRESTLYQSLLKWDQTVNGNFLK
jgi:hypothetical protein